mgnify:CR=1 FL=1
MSRCADVKMIIDEMYSCRLWWSFLLCVNIVFISNLLKPFLFNLNFRLRGCLDDCIPISGKHLVNYYYVDFSSSKH